MTCNFEKSRKTEEIRCEFESSKLPLIIDSQDRG
jgi:hypothetical protein